VPQGGHLEQLEGAALLQLLEHGAQVAEAAARSLQVLLVAAPPEQLAGRVRKVLLQQRSAHLLGLCQDKPHGDAPLLTRMQLLAAAAEQLPCKWRQKFTLGANERSLAPAAHGSGDWTLVMRLAYRRAHRVPAPMPAKGSRGRTTEVATRLSCA
jgi:hypothetical protein